MSKNIQISHDLFMDLCRFHLLEDMEPAEAIQKGLESKLEALMKHELYSKYKNPNLSEAERQEARKRYLDEIGMKDSFRWNSLKPPT